MNATYNSMKLDLAEVIHGILNLARLRQHEDTAVRAQELLGRLAEDRFQLAVVGRFNAGKSSLMNAIMGQPILPTGLRPLTSVITTVAYGSRPEVEVWFRNGGLPAHAQVADLAKYVTEENNPANQMQVESALVRAPVEALRRGFFFIDTPGIGSEILANTAATERFLPEADALIFVTSFDSDMQVDEVNFLKRVQKHARKTFLVVNKADLVEDTSRSTVIERLRGRMANAMGAAANLRVFAVSAQDGLAARQRRDPGRIERSGLPQLELALWEFLGKEKQREFLARTAERVAALIKGERLFAGLGQNCGAAEKALRIERLAMHAHRITCAGERCRETAKAKVSSELPHLLASELDCWSQKITVEEEDGEILLSPAWDIWARSQTPTLPAKVLRIAELEIHEMLRMPDELKRAAAELSGIWNEPVLSGRYSEVLERTHLPFSLPAKSTAIPLPWWTPAVPPYWRARLRKRAIVTAVAECVEICRARTVDAALDWTERLFRESLRRHNKEKEDMTKAVESAEAATDDQRLDELDQVLQQFRAAAAEWEEPWPAAPAPEGSMHSMRCKICSELAQSVYDFLAHDQYALATDPHRKEAHAAERGYCTLHAWQYESVASPQGVCVAYAPVLKSAASRLREAATDDSGCVVAAIGEALPSANNCRLCGFIAERERVAAEAIAARLSSDIDGAYPPLCVMHLRTVVAAGIPQRVVAKLMETEARILERCAEDMRMYAVKHDAVRRELMTDEERTAWRRGLAWIAGEPTMARPWRTS